MNRGVFGFNNFNYAERPPAAAVALSANQSPITTLTVTLINYDIVEYDPTNMFNSVTKQFRIPIQGVWRCSAYLTGTTSSTLASIQQLVYKNGASTKQGNLLYDSNAQVSAGLYTLLKCNVGDLIDFRGLLSGAGTLSFAGDAAGVNTYAAVEFVRPL